MLYEKQRCDNEERATRQKRAKLPLAKTGKEKRDAKKEMQNIKLYLAQGKLGKENF